MADEIKKPVELTKEQYLDAALKAAESGKKALAKIREDLPSDEGREPDCIKYMRSGLGAAIGALDDTVREIGA